MGELEQMSKPEKMARRFCELAVEFKLTSTGGDFWNELDEDSKFTLVRIFRHIQNELSSGVLQSWVTRLGFRHQGSLLTAIRGCDGVQKHDPSKPVMRAIRWATMVPFDERELVEPKGFMYYTEQSFSEAVRFLSKSLDEYPLHFILHLIHAVEIIGYCHPEDKIRESFRAAYQLFVEKFHMQPESKSEMEKRLCEDRVANGTVAN